MNNYREDTLTAYRFAKFMDNRDLRLGVCEMLDIPFKEIKLSDLKLCTKLVLDPMWNTLEKLDGISLLENLEYLDVRLGEFCQLDELVELENLKHITLLQDKSESIDIYTLLKCKSVQELSIEWRKISRFILEEDNKTQIPYEILIRNFCVNKFSSKGYKISELLDNICVDNLEACVKITPKTSIILDEYWRMFGKSYNWSESIIKELLQDENLDYSYIEEILCHFGEEKGLMLISEHGSKRAKIIGINHVISKTASFSQQLDNLLINERKNIIHNIFN